MNDEFKELQDKWTNSRKSIKPSASNLDILYKKIRIKEKENYSFYYGTVIILSITFIVISLFFYYLAPVRETLSRIGGGLMLLGLLFRIFMEFISIYKAKQINKLDNTLQTTENTINFHQFRKKIHQLISPVVLVLYTIGFYMLTPEFSLYIPFWNLVLWDISYVVIGIILFIIIRKGVKKEMQKLIEILKLKSEIME